MNSITAIFTHIGAWSMLKWSTCTAWKENFGRLNALEALPLAPLLHSILNNSRLNGTRGGPIFSHPSWYDFKLKDVKYNTPLHLLLCLSVIAFVDVILPNLRKKNVNTNNASYHVLKHNVKLKNNRDFINCKYLWLKKTNNLLHMLASSSSVVWCGSPRM